MIRNSILFCLLLFFSTHLTGQANPVRWTFQAQKSADGVYDLSLTAQIQSGWYLYSQHLEEGGPVPTTIRFTPAESYSLEGDTAESGDQRKEGYDDLFEMNVIKFAKRAVFTQRVRVSDPSKPISGEVEFMTCDDEQCLPPRTVPFSISLPN